MQLFKYVSAERFDILETELIRFSPASALNDPWEMKPHLEQFMSKDVWANLFRKRITPVQRERKVRRYWKDNRKSIPDLSLKKARQLYRLREDSAIAHVSNDDSQYKHYFLKQFEELGVLSLTEEPNNLLMWAHYCDSHRGFVIELNPLHNFFNAGKRRCFDPVIYAEKLPQLQEATDCFKDKAGLTAMCLTKDQRWSYEKEWRVIAHYRDATQNKPLSDGEIAWLYHLPAICVNRIILGCLMSPEKKKKITNYLRTDARYKHVRLQEAVRVEREYNLDFEDVS